MSAESELKRYREKGVGTFDGLGDIDVDDVPPVAISPVLGSRLEEQWRAQVPLTRELAHFTHAREVLLPPHASDLVRMSGAPGRAGAR